MMNKTVMEKAAELEELEYRVNQLREELEQAAEQVNRQTTTIVILGDNSGFNRNLARWLTAKLLPFGHTVSVFDGNDYEPVAVDPGFSGEPLEPCHFVIHAGAVTTTAACGPLQQPPPQYL